MLCSFMVVNVSAEHVYEEGFEIQTNYDVTIECEVSECGFSQYTLTSSQLIGDVIICTEKWFEDPEELYYENYDYYTSGEIVVNGNTAAYVENISEGYYECEMQLYSEYYYYTIYIRAYDEDSYNAWLEIIDGFTFNYEDEVYYEYYESYFPTTSTYWETDTFYIDTDMELVMVDDSEYYVDEDAECYSFYPVEYDEGWGYQDIGCSIDIFVYHPDDVDEGYNELVDMLNEWYEYNEYGDDDWDVYEINDTKLNGFDAVQFDAILRGDVEFAMFSRSIAVSDGENAYLIEIDCDPEYEDVFNDLCDIVAEDLHFNNAPADDDKAEEKADKDDKDTEDKKDAEEKDNSTVIIIVAVVAGVVILGVTAIIVLGKKKKQ